MRDATVRTRLGKFQQDVQIERHHLIADVPVASGGDDAGPAPHDFLLAALRLVALPDDSEDVRRPQRAGRCARVEVKLSQAKEGEVHVMRREIRLDGDLDDEQRARLLEIANKCPVHKTLTGEIRIDSKLLL